jgi:hypothetical protein
MTPAPTLLRPAPREAGACAINAWGFPVDDYEGDFRPLAANGCEMFRIAPDRWFVTMTASKQTIPEGECGTIDHRFLVDKNMREVYESRLKGFCERHRIPWRVPHWKILCKGATE